MKSLIGEKVSNYTIVSSYQNKVVLAFNEKAIEPWAVWYMGCDGTAHTGSYFYCFTRAFSEFQRRMWAIDGD